ncbi:DUF732 domain-containing protein [Corynebacterium breve]|uniref:DUF732 domain-containing protein n=1 Tax=Corynebacterium breve TaxID=3049799 RepID=A0ABY8VFU2_9CORY|nr:DUF732 domain-containing protein [Corynebacterium breve]WIM67508.1 DUF732 domain-containing protein [Corynebacterium breve]
MRKLLASTVALAAGLALAACGGATVESADVTATSSPASVTASPTTTSKKETTSSAQPVVPGDQPEDLGAREVDEVPEPSAGYAPEEQEFLDQVTDNKVKVDGVEDQLIGTARTICGGDAVTRDAVAGQLIEQGRTDLEYDEVVQLIDDAAHDHIC